MFKARFNSEFCIIKCFPRRTSTDRFDIKSVDIGHCGGGGLERFHGSFNGAVNLRRRRKLRDSSKYLDDIHLPLQLTEISRSFIFIEMVH